MPNSQLIFLIVIIAIFGLFMVRSGRKRQRDQAALSEGLKPGAEIMTTFGVFGTIKSIDDAENKLVIATGPGSELTIHRQALGRIVPPVDASAASDATTTDAAQLNGEPVVLGDSPASGSSPAGPATGGAHPAARAAERPTD